MSFKYAQVIPGQLPGFSCVSFFDGVEKIVVFLEYDLPLFFRICVEHHDGFQLIANDRMHLSEEIILCGGSYSFMEAEIQSTERLAIV